MTVQHDAPPTGLARPTAPGVTVVVPTHRRPELMRQAVQSVLSQRYDGLVEVVVVFDACDVDVPELSLPRGWRLRGVPNVRSRGLAGARNTGILEAGYGYVAFLDDDDTWLPGKLAAQMDVFERHPGTQLVGTAMQVDDGSTQVVREVPYDVVTHAQLVEQRFAGLHSSSFVFRRAHLLGELGMVDEDLPGSYGEDTDLLLRSSASTPMRVVTQPLVNVRWQGGSYFFGKWDLFADGLLYLQERHPDLGSSPRALSQLAFALAAAGRRRESLRWIARALRRDLLNVKAWLSLAMALHLASADRIARVAQRFGRGV